MTDERDRGDVSASDPPGETDPAARSRFALNRRRFLAATVVAGGGAGAVTVAGCAGPDGPTPPDAVTPPPAPDTVVNLRVNGEARQVPVDNRTSLLDMLRERLDLTGTKKGCNQGACGACTVLVDGQRINSCLTLAVMHQDAEVTTIEGLAEDDGTLHPLQQAFIERDGFQCGFCTPGQILSGIGCIAEGHVGSDEEIREWMSGNICRCGAYTHIVEAVRDAAGRA